MDHAFALPLTVCMRLQVNTDIIFALNISGDVYGAAIPDPEEITVSSPDPDCLHLQDAEIYFPGKTGGLLAPKVGEDVPKAGSIRRKVPSADKNSGIRSGRLVAKRNGEIIGYSDLITVKNTKFMHHHHVHVVLNQDYKLKEGAQ